MLLEYATTRRFVAEDPRDSTVDEVFEPEIFEGSRKIDENRHVSSVESRFKVSTYAQFGHSRRLVGAL